MIQARAVKEDSMIVTVSLPSASATPSLYDKTAKDMENMYST